MIAQPTTNTSGDYFGKYLKLAEGEDLLVALEAAHSNTVKLLVSLASEKESYAYAEGKWTVKQVLQHIIDTERVFVYRALRIARGDKTSLPGYDENHFADNDHSDALSLNDVLEQYHTRRIATITFFKHLANATLDNEGNASNVVFTPRILGWILVGHDNHHRQVLQSKYGL